MAKTRQIKHDFFLNEDLARLPPLTRLLFCGLWLLADREGRVEDRPERIKAQLFPYHSAEIGPMLDELWKSKFLVRYVVNEVSCLQISKFTKHQHIHPDEKPSILPEPKIADFEIPGNPRKSPEIMHNLTYTSSYTSPSPSIRKSAEPKRDNDFQELMNHILKSYWSLDPHSSDPSVKKQVSAAYKRHSRALKEILEMAGGKHEKAKQGIDDIGSWLSSKGLSWNLNTISRHFLDWNASPRSFSNGKATNAR